MSKKHIDCQSYPEFRKTCFNTFKIVVKFCILWLLIVNIWMLSLWTFDWCINRLSILTFYIQFLEKKTLTIEIHKTLFAYRCVNKLWFSPGVHIFNKTVTSSAETNETQVTIVRQAIWRCVFFFWWKSLEMQYFC